MSLFGSVAGILGAGGGDVLSSAISGYAGYRTAKMTNEMNYRIFKEQLEYDKPVNQVERLKEAGLNPNLIYGSGIQNTQTAGKQPEMKNPFDKAIAGLNVGLLRSQLRKADAEARQSESNAFITASAAKYAPVLNQFSVLQNYENYYRSILNNERFRYDNALLMNSPYPSFDRGPVPQTVRAMLYLYDKLSERFTQGINNASRPNLGGRSSSGPTDGNFISALSPAAFTPAGSWAFGSSY